MAATGIGNLFEVLQWSGRTDVADAILDTWVNTLSHQLGTLLAAVRRDDLCSGERLLDLVRALPDTAVMRVLVSPSGSDRLLWPERHNLRETADWLLRAMTAELGLADSGSTGAVVGWTALGDAEITLHGVRHAPHVGGVPVDWNSPAAKAIDRSPASLDSAWEDLTDDEKSDVLVQTDTAFDAIGKVNPDAQAFVSRFTRVLMLQKRSGIGFRTRSPERRIGLTLFQNPHLKTVDQVDLAEGLIHEAIHSALDVDERVRQVTRLPQDHWVRNPDLYDGASRVVSPWTGAPLALPTFLQACFVWYGLLHHWCLALPAAVFVRERVKMRIAQSAAGFLGVSLVDLLGENRRSVGADVCEALEQMQSHVANSLGEAASCR